MLTQTEIDSFKYPFDEKQLKEFDDFGSFQWVSASQQAIALRFLATIKQMNYKIDVYEKILLDHGLMPSDSK